MDDFMIYKALENKLKPEDISLATSVTKELADKQELTVDLCSRSKCNSCPLKENGRMTLPQGNMYSPLMIIGDYPSKEDSFVRMPFYDAAGRLLTLITEKLNMDRNKIYTTNVVKCYTDDSWDKAAFECAAKFMMREINVVSPKVILVLGEKAKDAVYSLYVDPRVIVPPMQELRGKEFMGRGIHKKVGDEWVEHNPIVMFSYHPREVLEKAGAMYNKYKVELWNDVKNAVVKAIS